MIEVQYTPKPQPAMSTYAWSHSNCNDCHKYNLSAKEARLHYIITGHFVVTQIGATWEGTTVEELEADTEHYWELRINNVVVKFYSDIV